MALYDEKKTKLFPGGQLVPGSGAEKVANAISDFKARYQAGQARMGAGIPDYNVPRPAVAAPPAPKPSAAVAPATASPAVASPPAKKSPSQSMTLDQANAAEVNARTSTQTPAQPTTGAGAPSTVGGAAPVIRSRGKFGETVFSNTGSQYGNAAGTIASPSTTVGSVNQQNFGNPVVPQAPGSIARPGIASTFGLSVNDPRIDDQRAIARPQLGPNQLAGGGTLRGPDAMAEQYNNRENIEARNKVLGDIDTALFLARGKPNSAEVMSDLLQTKARVAGGAEQLSAEALQGRANRSNVLANTDMEQMGQTQRQQMAGDVTREGNQLDFTASQIAKPDIRQLEDRSLVDIAGGVARPVLDAQGNPVRGAVQQVDSGAVQPKDALAAINKELASLVANPPEMGGDATAYNARIEELRAQQAAYLGGGGAQAARNPQQTKPDLATFLARAKAQGSKMTEEQLKAAYANL